MKYILLFACAFSFAFNLIHSQVSLTGATYTQNFNTLANSGTSSTVITGWSFLETGSSNNTTYGVTNGSSTTGDTYSLGTTSSTDRAFGGLQSGSLVPTIGVQFENNTGATITSLDVSYIGEQWRLGATGRTDRMDFQYSLNATSLNSGTWVNVNTLDFNAPISTGTAGALDGNASANRTSITSSIGSLSIANGATIWFRWNSFDATSADDALGIDEFQITPVTSGCVTPVEPTSVTSAITYSEGCTSVQINFTNGNGTNRLIVMSTDCSISDPVDNTSYTSNNTYGSGATTGTNDYVVYSGNTATTIVDGLTAGTPYCFKIYEFIGGSSCVNYLTSGVSSTSFTTATGCTTPQIRSILVNACTVDEGIDELVVLNTGSSSLDINSMRITFPNGGDYCNSGCGTQTLVNNSTFVNQLNSTAGCTLFQYSATVPANSTLIVFTGLTPVTSFDYSAECPGGGPYYVVFCNNSSTVGRFANNAGATRSLSINFGASSDAVTYNSSSGTTGDDGDYVSFDNDGNTVYGNTSTCAAPIPLFIELLDFTYQLTDEGLQFFWETDSEKSIDHFNLKHFANNDFVNIHSEQAIGTENVGAIYNSPVFQFDDAEHYFLLEKVDVNGRSEFSQVISVSILSNEFKITKVKMDDSFVNITFNQELKANDVVKVCDINGRIIVEQLIYENTETISFIKPKEGLYFVSTFTSNVQNRSKTFKIRF